MPRERQASEWHARETTVPARQAHPEDGPAGRRVTPATRHARRTAIRHNGPAGGGSPR